MVAANSFVYLPEDVFAFFTGYTLHENARGRALVEVVTDKTKPLLRVMMRAASVLLASMCGGSLNSFDEADELGPCDTSGVSTLKYNHPTTFFLKLKRKM